MKKTLLLASAVALFAVSCGKKSTTTTPTTTTPTPTTTTNPMDGNWNIKEYDNLAVTTPGVGTYKVTTISATTGTVAFDLTNDGVYHYTENDSFTLSNSNANVVFVKTSGNFTVLSGGNTWTIDTMNSSVLRIKSKLGLVIRMTK